jgi:hypothetical protein
VSPDVVTDVSQHPLGSPEDWWPMYLGPGIAGLSNNWMRRHANAFETSVLNLSVRLGCNRSKQTSSATKPQPN